MSFISTKVNPTNPASRDEQIGIWIRDGMEVTVPEFDIELPWHFKFIWVTVAGSVVYENQAGKAITVPNLPTGFLWPGIGRKILTAGTTATGIYVYTSE